MRIHFSEVETTLGDGTDVVVRRIRPDDVERLRTMVAGLSDESRRRRFMTPVKELGLDELRFLTDVDFVHHIAWIAVLAADPEVAIGVARCVRAPDQPDIAEAAVTVLDAYQSRGLGSLLLALLATSAQAVGIERFRAYILESNVPMRRLLEDMRVPVHFDSPGLLCVDVSTRPESVADSPAGRALIGSARDVLRLAARRQPEQVAGSG